MSSSRDNLGSGGPPGRSVRFANEPDVLNIPARSSNNKDGGGRISSLEDDDHDDDDHLGRRRSSDSLNKKSKIQNKKKYYQNEDELDDIDDWNEEDDIDNDVAGGGAGAGTAGIVASERQLIEAKRQRRQKRGGVMEEFEVDDDDYNHHLASSSKSRRRATGVGGDDDDDDDDAIDDYEAFEGERSLKSEGVKIEPFHMRDEEEDGTGYFDGDTYVFRRNPNGGEGDADAWADALNDPEQEQNKDGNEVATTMSSSKPISRKYFASAAVDQENLDDLTKEELHGRIYNLISDAESVAKAIQRYGKIMKQEQNQRRELKKTGSGTSANAKDQHTESISTAESTAKSCLDRITGAANALLLQGDVDIYQTTGSDIRRKYPNVVDTSTSGTSGSSTAPPPTKVSSPSTTPTQWEYVGNENNQIQGPFTTQQMLSWIQAGYFVGEQRVRIRTIHEQEEKLSTEDDLLADLDDDDDGDDDSGDDPNPNPKKKPKTKTIVLGEWMWSNEVDYKSYL